MKMGRLSVNVSIEKCSKKPALSVNPQHNGQKFTDKSLENADLSVILSEILACRPE